MYAGFSRAPSKAPESGKRRAKFIASALLVAAGEQEDVRPFFARFKTLFDYNSAFSAI
jgi:hypothetical protein